MATPILYRYCLIQQTSQGNNQILLQSNLKNECLRKRAQLLRDNSARFKPGSLLIRTYFDRPAIHELFGDGIYGAEI